MLPLAEATGSLLGHKIVAGCLEKEIASSILADLLSDEQQTL